MTKAFQTPPVEITPERIVQDILLLVGYKVPRKTIKTWSEKQRESVCAYCGAVHFKASDNHVKIPKKPSVMKGLEQK